MSTDKIIKDLSEHNDNKRELMEKETAIYRSRINRQYNDLIKTEKNTEKAKSINVGKMDKSYFDNIKKDTMAYLKDARNSKVFVTNTFAGIVPFYRKNIILLGGLSGDGKSTTCANIAYGSAIRQAQKVLIISNEEVASDVYNRISCMIKGWSYNNHDKFTDGQIEELASMTDILRERITVIDDSYNDEIGQTSTIEGIEGILNSLIRNKNQYDVIIIDYYQNIDRSTQNPGHSSWQVQEQFASYIDKFKNVFDGAIVLFAQLKPSTQENGSFKDRIEGRKSIFNKCTCAIEIKAERERLRTSWHIIKSRWNQHVGKTLITGYEKGKYVEYTPEFKNYVTAMKESREKQKILDLGNKKLKGFK